MVKLNGLCAIFKEGIEKMQGGSLKSKLSRFLLRYRVTPHSTTGTPPAQLRMKRHLFTKLDLLRPSVENRVRDKQTTQKALHDLHAKPREVNVEDSAGFQVKENVDAGKGSRENRSSFYKG